MANIWAKWQIQCLATHEKFKFYTSFELKTHDTKGKTRATEGKVSLEKTQLGFSFFYSWFSHDVRKK